MAPVFVIALCTAAFVLFFFLSVCSISPLSLFLFVFEVLPLQVYVLSGPGYRYCTAASGAHKPCRTALTKTLLIERNLVNGHSNGLKNSLPLAVSWKLLLA